jgi:hypothetical protein
MIYSKEDFGTQMAGGGMRKYLTQAMIAESISRLKDAARTFDEFNVR